VISVNKIRRIGQYIFLTIASLISVFPLLWVVVSATNKSIDVIRGRLLPGNYLMENLKALMASQNLSSAMLNSFRNSIVLTFVSLLVCSLAGYGFEIYHDRGKDLVMTIILLAMMVPFAATMIPLFQSMSDMGLQNTMLGFMLPTISTPFLIMLFRQSARSFPHDMIDAARIDGLGELRIFFTMFFPTMRSTFAAAMTITFMNAWNSYLWPKVILLDAGSQTMPMLVSNLVAGYVTDYGMLMLAVFLCTIPTVIVFFLLQKSFANGITGTIK